MRLQICKAVAAIFWQSASYVSCNVFVCRNCAYSPILYVCNDVVRRNGGDYSIFNCSQTKFVAIILVLLVLFMRLFA